MNSDCKFFESVTKKWFYCSYNDEFQLKDDERLCEVCHNKPNEEEEIINE